MAAGSPVFVLAVAVALAVWAHYWCVVFVAELEWSRLPRIHVIGHGRSWRRVARAAFAIVAMNAMCAFVASPMLVRIFG